ncbi:MAG: hypothetical protein MI748_16155 [Opitutales bacterium]|nr:hypothetical protein [Opitutales bacterium]
MDDFSKQQRIASLLADLEKEIPTEDPKLRIHKQHKPYGNVLLGNRAGLLKFGIESMKTALEPHSSFEKPLNDFKDEALDEMQADELEPYAFWRDDDVEVLTLEQSREETRLDFGIKTRFWMTALVILFAGFLFVGVFTVVRKILDLV